MFHHLICNFEKQFIFEDEILLILYAASFCTQIDNMKHLAIWIPAAFSDVSAYLMISKFVLSMWFINEFCAVCNVSVPSQFHLCSGIWRLNVTHFIQKICVLQCWSFTFAHDGSSLKLKFIRFSYPHSLLSKAFYFWSTNVFIDNQRRLLILVWIV